MDDLDRFVTQENKHSTWALSPADQTEGACFGREVVCQCLSWRHRETAEKICRLLNADKDVGI